MSAACPIASFTPTAEAANGSGCELRVAMMPGTELVECTRKRGSGLGLASTSPLHGPRKKHLMRYRRRLADLRGVGAKINDKVKYFKVEYINVVAHGCIIIMIQIIICQMHLLYTLKAKAHVRNSP